MMSTVEEVIIFLIINGSWSAIEWAHIWQNFLIAFCSPFLSILTNILKVEARLKHHLLVLLYDRFARLHLAYRHLRLVLLLVIWDYANLSSLAKIIKILPMTAWCTRSYFYLLLQERWWSFDSLIYPILNFILSRPDSDDTTLCLRNYWASCTVLTFTFDSSANGFNHGWPVTPCRRILGALGRQTVLRLDLHDTSFCVPKSIGLRCYNCWQVTINFFNLHFPMRTQLRRTLVQFRHSRSINNVDSRVWIVMDRARILHNLKATWSAIFTTT